VSSFQRSEGRGRGGGLVAEEEENARGSGFAHDLDEIEFEQGHLPDPLGSLLADDDVDMIGLCLAFQPRGQIGIVAEYRIVEALVRSEVAGTAATRIETDPNANFVEGSSC
jgi:hypothetical protein